MRPTLRSSVEVLRAGPDTYLLRDSQSGESFQVGVGEHRLARLIDGRRSIDELRSEFEARFREPLSQAAATGFIEQLRSAGLIEEESTASVKPVNGRAAGAEPGFAPAKVALNDFFDALAMSLGGVLHPINALWVVMLGLIGLSILVRDFDVLSTQLYRAWVRQPLGLVGLILFARCFVVSLPRELLVGMACRRFGGRVYGFELRLVRLLPMFRGDVGDSLALMEPRGQWTLLTLRAWFHVVLASLALTVWWQTPPEGALGTFWAAVMLPSIVGLILAMNPFAQSDAYAALSKLTGQVDLYDRALAETKAWLGLRPSPETLSERARLWFRVYGVGVLAWEWFIIPSALVVAAAWIIDRYDARGAAAAITLIVWWFQEPARKSIMGSDAVRWLTFGGKWWLRWLVRLVVVALVVLCGWIPYQYEIGGQCHVLPSVEYGVRAEIADTIREVHVTAGQRVETGQRIATLAARDERANVAVTKAELDRAKADLDRLRNGPRAEELAAAAEEVELRRVQLEYYERELKRVQSMGTQDAASITEIDRAQNLVDAAQHMHLQAKQNHLKLANGTRPEEIAAGEATVARLQALLAHYEELLALHEVRSPVAGRIVTSNIEARQGQFVEPGDLIAVVQAVTEPRIEIAADEAAGVRLEEGMPVKVRFRGLDGALLSGRVVAIASATDDAGQLGVHRVRTDKEGQLEESLHRDRDRERYVRIIAALDDPPPTLAAYMTGEARVVVGDDLLWRAVARPIIRFFKVDVWSWLP